MDTGIILWLNELTSENGALSALMYIVTREPVKNLPPVLLFWMLWFAQGERSQVERREMLSSVLALACVAIGIGRVLANVLPFRSRPMYAEEIETAVPTWLEDAFLDGSSAFPSDHAVLFFSIATGLYLINRKIGAWALAHALFVVCLPRIALGWHWPSDILVGAIVGAGTTAALIVPLRMLIHRLQIVPFFEAREALGYPLLFLITFEIGRMFHTTQNIVDAVTG